MAVLVLDYGTRANEATNSRVTGHCLTQLLLQSFLENDTAPCCAPSWHLSRKLGSAKSAILT